MLLIVIAAMLLSLLSPSLRLITFPLMGLMVALLLVHPHRVTPVIVNAAALDAALHEEAPARRAHARALAATFSAFADARYTSVSLFTDTEPGFPPPLTINHVTGQWNGLQFCAYTVITSIGPAGISRTEKRDTATITIPSRWDVVEVLLPTPIAIPMVTLLPESAINRVLGRALRFTRRYGSFAFDRNWVVHTPLKRHPALTVDLVTALSRRHLDRVFVIAGDRFISLNPRPAAPAEHVADAVRLAHLTTAPVDEVTR